MAMYDEPEYFGDDYSGGNYADDYDDVEQDEINGANGNVRQARTKRRSKNDNVGRTFVCGCGKSYLSYPALYTHIKQKHSGEPPPGTNSAQFHTGRGRGRPRKEKPEHTSGAIVDDDKFNDQRGPETNFSQLSRDLTAEMLDMESLMLSKVSFPLKQKQIASLAAQRGGANDRTDGDNFTALDWYAKDPVEEDHLYKVVHELYQEVTQALSQKMDEHRIEKKPNAGMSTQYLLLVFDEDRALLSIDQVMALYLIDFADRCKKCEPIIAPNNNENDGVGVSTKSGSTSKAAAKNSAAQNAGGASGDLERNNYHFYMVVCSFIQLYRACLNDTIYQTFEGRTTMQIVSDGANFTASRSPECVPLVCNEFLTEFLPLNCNTFDMKTAIGLTQHFNTWLFHRKFTKTKISQIGIGK